MIYYANDRYAAVLTAGYSVGQSTLYVSAVPDNVPTIVVAAKGTDNETVFEVTDKTTNSLTGVSRLRGANVDLDAQTPLTCLNNEEFVNQYVSAVSSPETLANVLFGVDGGSTDDYAIALDPAPSEYVAGMLVTFKANTANTGAATLNVNGLGAKSIKLRGAELATGEIAAGQIVSVVYDGTDFQLASRIGLVKRVTSEASSASPTPDADSCDIYELTALAAGATFGAPTGTPTNGQGLIIRIKDNGSARSLSWNAIYRAIGVELPTTTVVSKVTYVGFVYNQNATKWDAVAVAQEE